MNRSGRMRLYKSSSRSRTGLGVSLLWPATTGSTTMLYGKIPCKHHWTEGAVTTGRIQEFLKRAGGGAGSPKKEVHRKTSPKKSIRVEWVQSLRKCRSVVIFTMTSKKILERLYPLNPHPGSASEVVRK